MTPDLKRKRSKIPFSEATIDRIRKNTPWALTFASAVNFVVEKGLIAIESDNKKIAAAQQPARIFPCPYGHAHHTTPGDAEFCRNTYSSRRVNELRKMDSRVKYPKLS